MNLLESYIRATLDAYLNEEFADATGAATPSSIAKSQPVQPVFKEFDLEYLKQMDELTQVIVYVEKTLGQRKIGQGQGRSVYRLDDGRVLKVAKNSGGIGQNEAEVTVCKTPATADIFPGIFESDPKFTWIVAEEAQPMTRIKFEGLTGVSWSEFISALGGAFTKALGNASSGELRHYQQMFDKHFGNKFFRRVVNLVKDCKYEPGDLAKLDSWGIVKNRPVIIDSGFTEAVNQAHYQR